MKPAEISSYYKIHCLISVFKMVLASLIGIFIIARFNIDNGYAILLPIVIIPIVYHESIEKNLLERGVGSFLGSVIGIVLLKLTENWLIFTLSLFTIMLFSMLYFAQKGLRYTMIWVFITMGIIYSMGYSDVLGSESFVVSWAWMLWLGVFICLIVEYTVFPRASFFQLKKLLSNSSLSELNLMEAERLLKVSRFRIPLPLFKATQKEISLLEKISPIYQELHAQKTLLLSQLKPSSKLLSLLEKLYQTLEDWTHALETPAGEKLQKTLKEDLHAYEETLALKSAVELNTLPLLHSTAENFHRIIERVNKPFEETPAPSKKDPVGTLEEFYGAMRIAITFITTIAITSFLGLPGGFQIVVVTATSCMQPNLGSLQKKIFDRFIGIVLGLTASIFFVLILGQIPTLWCLVLIYIMWISISAYFGISRPDWFYFSVQAAVIVILILASDTTEISPSTDIMWQRVSAIFEGYVISTVLMTLFGLKDPTREIPLKIRTYFESLRNFLEAKLSSLSPEKLQQQKDELSSLIEAAHYQIGRRGQNKSENQEVIWVTKIQKEVLSLSSRLPLLSLSNREFKNILTTRLADLSKRIDSLLKKEGSNQPRLPLPTELEDEIEKKIQALLNSENLYTVDISERNFFFHNEICLRNIAQGLYNLSLQLSGRTL